MSQGRIIDDLLDMSRMNTGKLTVNRVPLVLGEAVQPAVTWAISEARDRGLRLLAEGLDEPMTVDGDSTRSSRSPGTCSATRSSSARRAARSRFACARKRARRCSR
jgi:hypothetical protein